MSQAKARIQYRGKEVTVLGGHRAVLDCYKKKMLGQVIVEVEETEDSGVIPGSVIDIDSNGEKNVAGYATANVQVVPRLQEKTVEPSQQEQIVTADSENDGLSRVTVKAIQTQTKTATGNGTVEPDAGKYLSAVYVEVSKGEGAEGTRVINENGIFDVKAYAEVNVNVNPILQNKSVYPYSVDQVVTADEGYYGLGAVEVKKINTESKKITENGKYLPSEGTYFNSIEVDVPPPPNYMEIPNTEWNITKNGSYDVTRYARANVNVQPELQEKSVTPTASAQEVTADEGVYGLRKVTVEAVPTEEVTITEPVKEVSATPGKFISKVNVNVPTVTVHSGTSEPTNDIGTDGDIYLLLEG